MKAEAELPGPSDEGGREHFYREQRRKTQFGRFGGLGPRQEDLLIGTGTGSPEMGVCPCTDFTIDFILPLQLGQKQPKGIPSWPDLGKQ